MSNIVLPSPSLLGSIKDYFNKVNQQVHDSKVNVNENSQILPIILGQETHREFLTPELSDKFYHSTSPNNQYILLEKNIDNLKAINHLYRNYIRSRNQLSLAGKHSNYPAFLLKQYGLQKHNLKEIIDILKSYLHTTLDDATSTHSFWEITQSFYLICHIPNTHTANIKTAISLLQPYYPLLSQFSSQIKYINSNKSSTLYNPNSNSFTVSLKIGECPNHKFISLLHELSHVGYILSNFSEEKNPWLLGKYQEELSVAKTLTKTLPEAYPKLWRLYQTEKRLFITNLLFQLIAYRKEPKSPSSLYLKMLKGSYPYANLKLIHGFTYLYHKNIMSEPLNGLTQALSFINSLN